MSEPNKYQKLRQKYSSEAVDAAIKLCGKYELKENYENMDMLSLNLHRYGENTVESSLKLQKKHTLPLDSLRDINEALYCSDPELLEKVITMMERFELGKRSGMFSDLYSECVNYGQQVVEKILQAVKTHELPFTPFWTGFLRNLYRSNDAKKMDEALKTLKNEFIDLSDLYKDDLVKFFKVHGFKIKD
jgi:hypothetical protein